MQIKIDMVYFLLVQFWKLVRFFFIKSFLMFEVIPPKFGVQTNNASSGRKHLMASPSPNAFPKNIRRCLNEANIKFCEFPLWPYSGWIKILLITVETVLVQDFLGIGLWNSLQRYPYQYNSEKLSKRYFCELQFHHKDWKYCWKSYVNF